MRRSANIFQPPVPHGPGDFLFSKGKNPFQSRGGREMIIEWIHIDGNWEARIAGLDPQDTFFPWE
jgi:hypothetical protein